MEFSKATAANKKDRTNVKFHDKTTNSQDRTRELRLQTAKLDSPDNNS